MIKSIKLEDEYLEMTTLTYPNKELKVIYTVILLRVYVLFVSTSGKTNGVLINDQDN